MFLMSGDRQWYGEGTGGEESRFGSTFSVALELWGEV